MKTALYVILPLILIISASKNTIAQENAEDVTVHFFELFQSKGVDVAVDYIYSTNKWLVSDKTTADNIKLQLKKGIAIIGQYSGYELIGKKALGESYVQLDYMLRYDRQPIKFTFILYKPNKTWQIQNMKPDDRLEDDIENLPK